MVVCVFHAFGDQSCDYIDEFVIIRDKMSMKIKGAYTFDKIWLNLSWFWLVFQKFVKDRK